MSYKGNIGFLFQHLYFKGINFLADSKDLGNKKLFNDNNNKLFTISILPQIPKPQFCNVYFQLQTTYPGLLTGTGYTHETGKEGELKLGFNFDYTSGLPIISGSTVKGLLKSCFDNQDLLEIACLAANISKVDWSELKSKCFENDQVGSYLSDIFLDAVPISISSFNAAIPIVRNNLLTYDGVNLNNKYLMGLDNLAPHKHALKDPIPLSFLKVMPEVVFEFRFRLSNNVLSAPNKENLYREALKLIGAGAKTNVGYGQLVDFGNNSDKTLHGKHIFENSSAQIQNHPKREFSQFPKKRQNFENQYQENRIIYQQQPTTNQIISKKEQTDWPSVNSINIGDTIIGYIHEVKSGNARVQLFIKGQKELLNLQGFKGNVSDKIELIVKEKSGSIKNNSVQISKIITS
jgi:CRISPR-associated protein Cmr6